MSARKTAIAEMRTRLQGITVANGYNTDVGKYVLLGEHPVLGPDDPDACVCLVVRPDVPGHQAEHAVVALPVEVQALVKLEVDDPGLALEDLIEDIKRAIETDHDLGGATIKRGLERGPTRPFDREAGSETVGAGVEYVLRLRELWGSP